MNQSNWVAPDIVSVCKEQLAPLPQCSPGGFLYLALLTQLYGSHNKIDSLKNSYDTKYPSRPSILESDIISSMNKSLLEQDKGKPTLGRRTSSDIYPLQIGDLELFEQQNKYKANDNKSKKYKTKRKQSLTKHNLYDFIIVGAGSAGCVLANRLSEVKKWKILLIEAGPEEPDITSVPGLTRVLSSSNIDWMYNTQPEESTCKAFKRNKCTWPRGKTMGGSSAINYMVYMRGNKRDYDGWAKLGNVGWSYKEVLPYFKMSENNRNYNDTYHSIGGPLNVETFKNIDNTSYLIIEGFKQRGLPVVDFNGNQQIGTGKAQSTSLKGKRFSTNAGYIIPVQHKRPNLHIIKNAFVTKILIDSDTKNATGVKYIKKNGKYFLAFASKEVISCAGAINSPKLLMLSGIGPTAQLEKLKIPVIQDLKVGNNLQDHVSTVALLLTLTNKNTTYRTFNEINKEVYRYFNQPAEEKDGPLATTSLSNVVAFIKTKFALEDAPDIQIHFDGKNVTEFYSDPVTYLSSNIFPHSFYDGIGMQPLLLTPQSRGFILLNKTDPTFGPPLIYPRYFTHHQNLDVFIEGLKFVVGLEKTKAFRQSGAKFVKVPVRGCTQHTWGTYDYFACIATHYTSTLFHPVGTCKMGPKSDKDAVVDPNLCVYG